MTIDNVAGQIISAANRSIGSTTGCTITEKAPTRAFSWLKAPTSPFTFKTLLRNYAKRALTREAKGASKVRDPRSVSKLRHTRGPQYGLGCGGDSEAVTWIPVSVSVDTPRHVTGASGHLKSAVYGRTHDGRRNYVHFVTDYNIHFIVNNKYYAMKIQEKSESFPEIPEIP